MCIRDRTSSMAQSLNKMNWLNEPQQWEIKDGKTLVMDVPASLEIGQEITGEVRTIGLFKSKPMKKGKVSAMSMV